MHAAVETGGAAAREAAGTDLRVWRGGLAFWALVALALALALLLFRSTLRPMLNAWGTENYTHGVLIPFIAAFLVWQRKDDLERMPFPGSWAGVALVIVAFAAFGVGQLSTLFVIGQYALVLLLAALMLTVMGWTGFRRVWAAAFILALAVPLPEFLYQRLSASLQLISSEGGVWLIRQFGIGVHLEGNVIDLGPMQLQVAEACNGLRYLFPLMTLGFVAAYFYQAPFWKRAVLFLSTIPVTVAMNSVRIGLIGVTVEYWGMQMAEGLVHEFEGWIFFGVAGGVLLTEVLLLSRLGGDRRPLSRVLGLTFPARTPRGARVERRTAPVPLLAAVVLLAGALIGSTFLPERAEARPERRELLDFPHTLGEWKGHPVQIEDIFVDRLKVNDHLMLDLSGPQGSVVNLWIAYYDSQRQGGAAHSPASCLPGGGFKIESFEDYTVPGIEVGGVPLAVNRSVMRYGRDRQLVWYWFQQRGRVIRSEYLVKWYILWDAITRQRTDGALVRLMMSVPEGTEVAEADRMLASVARELAARLPEYVPN
jgi:exosortase D (VPLPA-CTERM-specific)